MEIFTLNDMLLTSSVMFGAGIGVGFISCIMLSLRLRAMA